MRNKYYAILLRLDSYCTICYCNPIRISYIICYVLKLPSLTASPVCTKPQLHDIVYLHRVCLQVFPTEMCLYTFEYRLLLLYLASDVTSSMRRETRRIRWTRWKIDTDSEGRWDKSRKYRIELLDLHRRWFSSVQKHKHSPTKSLTAFLSVFDFFDLKISSFLLSF